MKALKHLAGILALVALAGTAGAADYPDRPISLMVAYSPGGATDFQARIVTMVAANEEYLGQPIVIINKPGAGGQVGWNWFATKAKADGYDSGRLQRAPLHRPVGRLQDGKYNIEKLRADRELGRRSGGAGGQARTATSTASTTW